MNYWLSPRGQVWAMQMIGEHMARAIDIIQIAYPDKCNKFGIYDDSKYGSAVEFLESKGYIRYMDWGSRPQ